ncbi:tyrosine-protein phosphatase [Hirschia baltica]|uniref:Protein tyrosine/serine phosphatase n=1 Tax=Hirschia baltica (strain ATCC 49814 / DSM 5838 / IFAM 1418) TaxID=582402 RepID=C6XQ14_HIRBI|nr:tyrosine-protein phosphatase [Hirschia baltica]ACT58531.1 protein tyrosine/serine phosphatase [Hirschia baltica ATCC 49814]
MQDRIKPLLGVKNFRDFGGYETVCGRRVKTGKLYRTAALNKAQAADLDFLNKLDIGFQVDLRRQSERVEDPNLWGPHEVHTFNDLNAYKASHLEFMDKGNLTGDEAHNFMLAYYKVAPWVEAHVDLYTRWFQRLAETEGAGLINCAAGKDRTGLGCAVTLSLLGVPEKTIFEDYVLTNETINIEEILPLAREKWESRLGLVIEDEALYPFIAVRTEYLQCAWDEIKSKHGSILAYANDVLKVDDQKIERLKSKLLD